MNATLKNKIEKFYADNKTAVDSLAAYLKVPPIWLVCVWDNESGLNPAIQNSIGATGLNQMMPATLAGYGITKEQYKAYTPAQQMEVMRMFFKPIAGKIKRAGDLYLFNFLPAAVQENVSADYVLGQAGSTEKYKGLSKNLIYQQNKSLDYNKDGQITRRDFWDGFEAKYDELVKGSFFFRELWIDIKQNWIVWLVCAIILISISVYIYL